MRATSIKLVTGTSPSHQTLSQIKSIANGFLNLSSPFSANSLNPSLWETKYINETCHVNYTLCHNCKHFIFPWIFVSRSYGNRYHFKNERINVLLQDRLTIQYVQGKLDKYGMHLPRVVQLEIQKDLQLKSLYETQSLIKRVKDNHLKQFTKEEIVVVSEAAKAAFEQDVLGGAQEGSLQKLVLDLEKRLGKSRKSIQYAIQNAFHQLERKSLSKKQFSQIKLAIRSKIANIIESQSQVPRELPCINVEQVSKDKQKLNAALHATPHEVFNVTPHDAHSSSQCHFESDKHNLSVLSLVEDVYPTYSYIPRRIIYAIAYYELKRLKRYKLTTTQKEILLHWYQKNHDFNQTSAGWNKHQVTPEMSTVDTNAPQISQTDHLPIPNDQFKHSTLTLFQQLQIDMNEIEELHPLKEIPASVLHSFIKQKERQKFVKSILKEEKQVISNILNDSSSTNVLDLCDEIAMKSKLPRATIYYLVRNQLKSKHFKKIQSNIIQDIRNVITNDKTLSDYSEFLHKLQTKHKVSKSMLSPLIHRELIGRKRNRLTYSLKVELLSKLHSHRSVPETTQLYEKLRNEISMDREQFSRFVARMRKIEKRSSINKETSKQLLDCYSSVWTSKKESMGIESHKLLLQDISNKFNIPISTVQDLIERFRLQSARKEARRSITIDQRKAIEMYVLSNKDSTTSKICEELNAYDIRRDILYELVDNAKRKLRKSLNPQQLDYIRQVIKHYKAERSSLPTTPTIVERLKGEVDLPHRQLYEIVRYELKKME